GLDMRDVVLNPIHTFSQLSNEVLSHPLSFLSYTTLGKVTSAQLEMTERLTKLYTKPKWGIETVTSKDGSVYKITPQVIQYKNFVNFSILLEKKSRKEKGRNHFQRF